MAAYVLLSKLTTVGLERLRDAPDQWSEVRGLIEAWEGKILYDMTLLGEYDHCLIFEAPDNFKAHRACSALELSKFVDSELLPAVDMPLFSRLISQSTETTGPHEWQITWWARILRRAFQWHAYSRYTDMYCKPLTITGREHFDSIDGPCIVIANHTSHMDGLVLMMSLPTSVRLRTYTGAAADRWFLKDAKDLAKKPWYQSLAVGSFPIQRGGGSRSLDYPKWLLDQGCNVMVYPEGTRSGSKALGRFRYGVSIMALEKKVPVVPCFLTGLAAMRPKGSRVIRPGPAGAHFLEPVYFDEGTSVPDATRILFDRMNAVHKRVSKYGPDAAAKSDEELEAAEAVRA